MSLLLLLITALLLALRLCASSKCCSTVHVYNFILTLAVGWAICLCSWQLFFFPVDRHSIRANARRTVCVCFLIIIKSATHSYRQWAEIQKKRMMIDWPETGMDGILFRRAEQRPMYMLANWCTAIYAICDLFIRIYWRSVRPVVHTKCKCAGALMRVCSCAAVHSHLIDLFHYVTCWMLIQ